MIQGIDIQNYLGEKLHIILGEADPDHGLLVIDVDGLGPVKGDIHRTDLATRHGSKVNSARAEERNIVMTLRFTFAPQIEDSRQLTYKYFPLLRPLNFTIKTDNRTLETVGYVEKNEPEIFEETETTEISIICEDPWLYDALTKKQYTEFYGVTPLFEFPFSNESLTEPLIEFGRIEVLTERVLTYYGDADVGITINIKILNIVGDISIYKIDTREKMTIFAEKIEAITGYGLSPADEIEICTVRGSKSATLLRNGIYYNILNALDLYSDWFQISKGDNIFVYTADVVSSVNLLITNRIAYEGI